MVPKLLCLDAAPGSPLFPAFAPEHHHLGQRRRPLCLLVPLKWASLLLLLAVYVCLWQGLRAVREKAGLPPRAGAAGCLVIWYLLMCVLGVVEYGGLILVAALLAVYFLILRSLFRCSRELDEAGYGIQSAPVRIPDGWVVKGLVLLVLIGGACGYLFGNRYPMDWRPVEETAQAAWRM